MPSLDERTIARVREAWGDDLPDEAIRRTFVYAWVRMGIALHDLARAVRDSAARLRRSPTTRSKR